MLPQMHLFSPEVQKFVLAAECLMFGDVTPQSLTETDLKAIRYYVQCLIEKFETSAFRTSNHDEWRGLR